eukprot:2357820-Amphidinium_carterae.1
MGFAMLFTTLYQMSGRRKTDEALGKLRRRSLARLVGRLELKLLSTAIATCDQSQSHRLTKKQDADLSVHVCTLGDF